MITQIVARTPLWVFGLFIVLIIVGLKQTRTRNINAVRAYFLPIGMIALSLGGVLSSFGLKPVPVALWLLGLLIVTWIGLKYFHDDRVSFVPTQNAFRMPGSWVPFFVIMAIFFTKYAVAIMQARHPELMSHPTFVAVLGFIYGCYSGYFSAKAANLVFNVSKA